MEHPEAGIEIVMGRLVARIAGATGPPAVVIASALRLHRDSAVDIRSVTAPVPVDTATATGLVLASVVAIRSVMALAMVLVGIGSVTMTAPGAVAGTRSVTVPGAAVPVDIGSVTTAVPVTVLVPRTGMAPLAVPVGIGSAMMVVLVSVVGTRSGMAPGVVPAAIGSAKTAGRPDAVVTAVAMTAGHHGVVVTGAPVHRAMVEGRAIGSHVAQAAVTRSCGRATAVRPAATAMLVIGNASSPRRS